MGVIVGVASHRDDGFFWSRVCSRNMLSRFKALDLFNEIQVFGRSLGSAISTRTASNSQRNENDRRDRRSRLRPDESRRASWTMRGLLKLPAPGVAYVEPSLTIISWVRSNGHSQVEGSAARQCPMPVHVSGEFIAGQMISSAEADEAVVNETFVHVYGFEKPQDAIGKTIEFLAPPGSGARNGTREESAKDAPIQESSEEELPEFLRFAVGR